MTSIKGLRAVHSRVNSDNSLQTLIDSRCQLAETWLVDFRLVRPWNHRGTEISSSLRGSIPVGACPVRGGTGGVCMMMVSLQDDRRIVTSSSKIRRGACRGAIGQWWRQRRNWKENLVLSLSFNIKKHIYCEFVSSVCLPPFVCDHLYVYNQESIPEQVCSRCWFRSVKSLNCRSKPVSGWLMPELHI